MTSNLDPADELFAIRNQIEGSLSRIDENGFVATSGEFLQRITAYLDTLPHAGEPVAWRYRFPLDGNKGEAWTEWHFSNGPHDPGPSIGGKHEAFPLYATPRPDTAEPSVAEACEDEALLHALAPTQGKDEG